VYVYALLYNKTGFIATDNFTKRKAPEGASADYLSHYTPSAGEYII
jgi:hypothetical protein